MPLLANFKIEAVKEILGRFGIHALEEFADGQIRWGNEPLRSPYRGSSHMADFYRDGRYDIFTIRAIANKLDKAGALPQIEKLLFESLANEEYRFSGDEDQPQGRRPN